MTAKNKSERLKRLITHGFFAPELPPCFVSDDLGRYRKSILNELKQIPPVNGKTALHRYITEPCWFYFPRHGRDDRKHGILNPVSFLLLADVISENFVDLRKRSKKSTISASPLIFDWSGGRALLRSSIDLRDDFRLDLSARREEYIEADIRAFFHSIYTHSIPWAIYGKAWAKNPANRGLNHYGNLLDLYCRNAQNAQTIGLPVGPDTSRLISEVIASAIDYNFRTRVSVGSQDASRYIDDYTISSVDGSSAESLIATLRQCISEFELELNSEKTSIVPTSARYSAGWKSAIRALVPKYDLSQAAFQRFFYEVVRIHQDQPSNNIEKFALQNARSAVIRTDDWPFVQSYIISLYRRNSTTISLLVELFILRQVRKADVDKNNISDFVNNRLPILARENRTGEICWLLFLSIRLELRISKRCINEICEIENSLVALLATVADRQGLLDGILKYDRWDFYLDAAGLKSHMWLYSYEAVAGGYRAGVSRSFIENDPYFGPIYRRGVRFLDVRKGFISVAATMRTLRNSNHLTQLMRADFNDDFDFDIDEYDENFDDDINDENEY